MAHVQRSLQCSSVRFFGTLRVMQRVLGCAIHPSVDPTDPSVSVDSACPPTRLGANAASPSVIELKRSLEAVSEVERSISHSRRRRALVAITLFVALIVIFARAVVLRA